jgi:EpsI family protein
MRWLRFLIVAALLGGTALFLHSRGRAETPPSREPLALFPLRVGNWQGREIPIPQWALDVLGAGEFAERNYTRDQGEPPIDLFIAYFPSNRMGSTMHSPQNCLPGSGWAPVESTRIRIARPPGEGQIGVNRYVLAKGLDHVLVLYWYQQHGRAVASEYWSKYYLVADSIRTNRSDAALVRVITPIAQNESVASPQQRSVAFVEEVLPLLEKYIPR